ncbi:hypothetical protein ACFX12_000330 [Malus domestica]
MASRVADCRDAAGEVFRLPLSYFGTPRLGTLHLGTLQELIHQGRLLCEGARLLYDLSGQVLFVIRIGRAWKEYASLSNGMVVDSGLDI